MENRTYRDRYIPSDVDGLHRVYIFDHSCVFIHKRITHCPYDEDRRPRYHPFQEISPPFAEDPRKQMLCHEKLQNKPELLKKFKRPHRHMPPTYLANA